jgi:uncharacterized protein
MAGHRFSSKVLDVIATAVTRAPLVIVAGFLLLSAACGVHAAFRLQLRTDQNDLVSSDLEYSRRYLEFIHEFGDLEFLYVVVEVEGNPERAIAVTEAVVAEMAQLVKTGEVEGYFHRIPPEAFGDGILLLGSKDDLRELSSAVVSSSGFLHRFEDVKSFSDLIALFAELLDAPVAEGNRGLAEWGFRFLDVCLESMSVAARGGSPPPLEARFRQVAEAAESDPIRKGYLFSTNGALAFVEIMPRKDYASLEVIDAPLRSIRHALDRVRARFPGVKLGLTGRPVLQADEMEVTNRDMQLATGVALTVVVGLFIFFFRRLRRPLLAALALLVAIGITFGVVTVTIGYLTLLSIVFTVMLVGLGMDFGVLFISRYQEELLASNDVEHSVGSTLRSAGLGIITGGLSTSFVFFSALAVDFKGLAELGFVAGIGLLICLVTMITFLPALILVSDRHVQRRRVLHPPHPITIPALAVAARHPRTVLVVLGLITVLAAFNFRGIPFNWNLLDLQAKSLESVEYELAIIQKSDRSTWYAAYLAESLEEVDSLIDRLRPYQQKGIIGTVESVRDFVPRDQSERAEILAPAAAVLRELDVPEPAETIDAAELQGSLDDLLSKLDRLQSLSAGRADSEAKEAVRSLEALIRSVEAIGDEIGSAPVPAASRLATYQKAFFADLRGLEQKLERMLSPAPLDPAGIHRDLKQRFVSRSGDKFLVYAYPTGDIWNHENMEQFVASIREVDPGVTGTPIQVYESARLMHEGFLKAGLYSFLMVFAFLLVDFRSIWAACLTMTPVMVGLFWLFALMPRLGLDFNLANFFALPILIGCAVDGAVHLLHRFRETGSIADVGRATGTAVCLASLSNMFGFAAMALARHRGVASLGYVTALGCATILIAVVILLPSLFQVLESRRLSRKKAS